MLVRRDLVAKHRDLRLAVADIFAAGIGHVTQHLIVGAILFDDVKHMLDRAGIADFAGDDRIVRLRGCLERFRRVRRVARTCLVYSVNCSGVGASMMETLPASVLGVWSNGMLRTLFGSGLPVDSSALNPAPCRWRRKAFCRCSPAAVGYQPTGTNPTTRETSRRRCRDHHVIVIRVGDEQALAIGGNRDRIGSRSFGDDG